GAGPRGRGGARGRGRRARHGGAGGGGRMGADPPDLCWIDGAIVDAREARFSIRDHGLLYGDGVFEGIRVRHGRLFRLGDHLARLATGARALALELPRPLAEIREIVLATVRAHGTRD